MQIERRKRNQVYYRKLLYRTLTGACLFFGSILGAYLVKASGSDMSFKINETEYYLSSIVIISGLISFFYHTILLSDASMRLLKMLIIPAERIFHTLANIRVHRVPSEESTPDSKKKKVRSVSFSFVTFS